MNCNKRNLWIASTIASIGLACQNSNDDDSSSPKYRIGQGFVQDAQGSESITVSLADFSAGQKIVLMPFALGNTSTINGTTASAFNITWSLASQSASLDQPEISSRLDEPNALQKAIEADHNRRSFWNRFDPNNNDVIAFQNISGKFEQHRRALNNIPSASVSSLLTTATSGCPSTFYIPGSSKVDDESTYDDYTLPSSEVSSYYDGSDHCIVFMSNPVSEPSTDAVKTSVRKILDVYKNTIYQDSFANVGSYTFKPLIVVVDFSGPQWPTASTNKELQIAGAFFKGLSTKTGRPTIYVASDMTKLSTPFPTTSAQAIFHSTLAHEMQHAIMDYYKNRKNSAGSETLAIDEGFAHLMEDVFGFGVENFDSYAKSFLSVVPDGIEGALKANPSGALSNTSRGAAQTFLYYLTSRQGGLTFSSGSVTSSTGLDFIRAAVSAKTVGVANLLANFNLTKAGAMSWLDTVGGYFASLMVDGLSGVEAYSSGFDVENPQEAVTDLLSVKNKSFGLQYNNFRGITESQSQLKDLSSADYKDGVEVSYYQTQPVLRTITATDKSVTFDIPETANSGVAVVRIK